MVWSVCGTLDQEIVKENGWDMLQKSLILLSQGIVHYATGFPHAGNSKKLSKLGYFWFGKGAKVEKNQAMFLYRLHKTI